MSTREFTTQDMALVATLLTASFTHDAMRRVEGGCEWVYSDPTDRLNDVVDEYSNDEYYVEPRELVRKLGTVRRGMYEFMGHNPKRIRT